MAESTGSHLVLLEQLQSLEVGSKARFLGCVHAYIMEKAELQLHDQYPVTNETDPVAVVRLAMVLENVNRDIVQVGSWINVAGNVRSHSERRTDRQPPYPVATFVDATMIWSAGAIIPDKYRAAVLEYQNPLQNG